MLGEEKYESREGRRGVLERASRVERSISCEQAGNGAAFGEGFRIWFPAVYSLSI